MAQEKVYVVFDLDDTLLRDTGAGPRWVGRDVVAIPGAVQTVRWCRQQGYNPILYSMGDMSSRLLRLDAAGIPRSLFRYIFAPPRKNLDNYRLNLERFQRWGKVIYVGDSWRNDVAIALGRADAVVWVQGQRTPGILGTPDDLEHYPVWVVNSVVELPRIMPAILADGYRGQKKSWWQSYHKRVWRSA